MAIIDQPFNNVEDVWARRCFNVASATLEPVCTVVWCGYRITAPFGKFDCQASTVHEVALRALYFCEAVLLAIPAISLSCISQVFRCVGWALQNKGFTHVQGSSPEKDFSSNRQVKVMTFNIAAVPAGISYKVAGVPHWRSRIDGIVQMIRDQNPDVLVIEEAYDTAVQEELVYRLKDLYPHFFLHLGVGSLGGLGPGGVMMATKSGVKHFSDHSFENNPATQCRSFGCLELLEKPNVDKPFARVIGTHPAWRENEVKERTEQWQQIQVYIAKRNEADGFLPTLIAADTNFERDGDEGIQLQGWMLPCYKDPEPTCWHQLPMTWNPADELFQSHESYREYGDNAKHRPRQIDNVWLVKDIQIDGRMIIKSCERINCYDDPYSTEDASQWFDTRTAISDHHSVVATIEIKQHV